MNDKILTPIQFKFRAAMTEGDGIDIGIGPHLLEETGMTSRELGRSLLLVFRDLEDGGANNLDLNGIRLYARRRGHCIDAGNRQDFKEIGWEILCDVLDGKFKN